MEEESDNIDLHQVASSPALPGSDDDTMMGSLVPLTPEPVVLSDESPTKSSTEPKVFATLSSTFEVRQSPIEIDNGRDQDDNDEEEEDNGESRLFSFDDPKFQMVATVLTDGDEAVVEAVDNLDEDGESDNDDEWEESFVYVDLDEIGFESEIFAVNPDEYVPGSTRKDREPRKENKPTHPEVILRFHNLESGHPILEIGSKYYVGSYEDAMGSLLFFRKKTEQATRNIASSCKKLRSLLPELQPPPDKVFYEKFDGDKAVEYDLIANVHKLLRFKMKEVKPYGEEVEVTESAPSAGASDAVVTTSGNSVEKE